MAIPPAQRNDTVRVNNECAGRNEIILAEKFVSTEHKKIVTSLLDFQVKYGYCARPLTPKFLTKDVFVTDNVLESRTQATPPR